MTVDNFFKEISFVNRFLLDIYDHEIDFLFSLADSYKVNKLDLAHHILDYREKYTKKSRVYKKVIDLETGIEYSDIKSCTQSMGLDYQKGYRTVMNNPNKFKIIEVDNGRI